MMIKNLKKASKKIYSAARSKGRGQSAAAADDSQKIILYGDADTDGAVSVYLLEHALRIINSNLDLDIYIIDRETEGYGLNHDALDYLEGEDYDLMIMVDCGIGSVEEVERANEMGMEVVIIDHHEVLEEKPDASVIVDPKQEEDPDFRDYAASGLVYRLSELLLENTDQEPQYVELAAIATLADRMPLEKDNKKIVEEGVDALNRTLHTGLRALMAVVDFQLPANKEKIRRQLLPILGASDVEDHLSQTYQLLKTQDIEEAQSIVGTLMDNRKKSSKELNEMFNEIKSRVSADDQIVFEGDPSWKVSLAGAVATKVRREFDKPTFIFKKGEEQSRGGVRVPEGEDAVEAMDSCQELLEQYGGHAPAAGFTVDNENLKQFKQCLIDYFNNG
ncbi:MAG: DHH family phosphoesterase [Candidatus Paceibacterota bacterium]